jgi:hypothetical protein
MKAVNRFHVLHFILVSLNLSSFVTAQRLKHDKYMDTTQFGSIYGFQFVSPINVLVHSPV